MKIYVSDKWFVCEMPNNHIYILNWNSLGYHLKYVLGLELEQRRAIKQHLETYGQCRLEVAS